MSEKLKQFKANVDTLTLTATPIPRTLQFSLMGARDLSIINTAPPNRHPIQTELRSFGEDLIREAIQYETARGGQVFFVHNRVQNIMHVYDMLKKFVRPNPQKNIKGGILDKEGSIDISNVMIFCDQCGKGVKVGIKIEKNKKQRICKECKTVID